MAGTPEDFSTSEGESTDTSTVPTVETGIEPTPAGSKKPWGAIAGAGALTAVVVVGALALSSSSDNDTTETATAIEETEEVAEAEETEERSEDDATNAETGEETASESGSVVEEAELVEAIDEADFAMEAMDSAVAFGGSPGAVFDGERFVSLTMNEAGWALRTSVDGLDWAESPVTGLPDEGYITWMDVQDGTYVAAIDSYSEGQGQSVSLVTSQDGSAWSAAQLPQVGENVSFSGAALTDDGVMVLLTQFDNGFDNEVELLIELGYLEDGDYESYCGFDQIEPGGDIMIYICNFEDDNFEDVPTFEEPSEEEIQALADAFDAATTDEERAAIEAQLEELWGGGDPFQEDAIIVSPGQPGFDELSQIREAQNNPSMPITTITGPIDGPFVVANEFEGPGYTNGIAATDAGAFISFDVYQESAGSSTTIMTWTGSAWTEVGTPPETQGGQLHSLGNSLLFTGYSDFGGQSSFVSVDGSTWTEADFGSGDQGGFSQVISGDAGAVAVTMIYDGPGFAGPAEEVITIEKDGFILEIETFNGNATLSAADGEVIYELDETWEPTPDSDIARMNPVSGDITFLAPETGAELVVITTADIDAAFGFEDFDEEDFVEPERITEVRTTTDGVTWTIVDVPEFQNLSSNTSIFPVAVGDDEAIFSLETYTEPPAELFAFEEEGREPTDAEIEALELFDGGSSESVYVRVPLG